MVVGRVKGWAGVEVEGIKGEGDYPMDFYAVSGDKGGSVVWCGTDEDDRTRRSVRGRLDIDQSELHDALASQQHKTFHALLTGSLTMYLVWIDAGLGTLRAALVVAMALSHPLCGRNSKSASRCLAPSLPRSHNFTDSHPLRPHRHCHRRRRLAGSSCNR